MHTSAQPTPAAAAPAAPIPGELLCEAIAAARSTYAHTLCYITSRASLLDDAARELESLQRASIPVRAAQLDWAATVADDIVTVSAHIEARHHARAAQVLAARNLTARRFPAVFHSGRPDVEPIHLYEHWSPADGAWRILLLIDRSPAFHIPPRTDAIATKRSGVAA